jgi:hypothetical protein
VIIVFSKDRAFQLEACLRTLLAQCEDVKEVPVRVLWTASSAHHHRSYGLLKETYGEWPHIEFIEESHFRSDLIAMLGGMTVGSARDRFIRRLETLPAAWIQLVVRFLMRPKPAVLYVVDDTVFLKSFSFRRCATALLSHENSIAFSLRLGRNLTRFYMGNRDQKIPEMKAVNNSIYEFDWTAADGDFAYPLEISSSLLKTNLILSRLLRKKWHSPNTLELVLANMAGRYKHDHSMILTYLDPRAVSIPLNIVQKDFTDNRVGQDANHHPDRLCDLFLKGIRADLSALDGMNHSAVHVEIDLVPTA